MKFSFSNSKVGIVFGSGRGIGLGVVKALVHKTKAQIIAVYRSPERSKELLSLSDKHPDRLTLYQINSINEDDLLKLYEKHPDIDFIINAIGLLHDENIGPERKVEDCEVTDMVKAYEVNALFTVLIAKVFIKALKKKEPTLFSTVSAKVGSIDDNGLGGWYSYRASKAALNMFLKNMAIEFNRRACNTSVVAIHPGTTITNLSKPFIDKTQYKLHTIEDTGKNIIDVLDQTEAGKEAQFLSWDGSKIAW